MSTKKERRLGDRQRRFIFDQRSKFKPIRDDEIYNTGGAWNHIDEIVDYLKHFGQFKARNVTFAGALFYGLPGTGKTFAARRIATKADVLFADVMQFPRPEKAEIWTSRDVKKLFTVAKAAVQRTRKSIILFWEGFEAFLEDADKAAHQQLYAELDGIGGRQHGILLIAATAMDIYEGEGETLFDEQLLRRFPMKLRFIAPARKHQGPLLRTILSAHPHPDIDYDSFTQLMNDPTHAQIRDFAEEALRMAVRRATVRNEETKITEQDLFDALTRSIHECELEMHFPPDEQRETALHEMGHAVVAKELGRPVQMISLVIAADTGVGRVISELPREHIRTERDMRDSLAVWMAGYATEEIFKCTGVGSRHDLEHATEIAKNLAGKYAFGRNALLEKYGPMAVVSTRERPAGQSIINDADLETSAILKEAHQKALAIIRGFSTERFIYLAETLLAHTPPVMWQKEFDALYAESAARFPNAAPAPSLPAVRGTADEGTHETAAQNG